MMGERVSIHFKGQFPTLLSRGYLANLRVQVVNSGVPPSLWNPKSFGVKKATQKCGKKPPSSIFQTTWGWHHLSFNSTCLRKKKCILAFEVKKKYHVGKERQHTATLCKQGSWDNTSWRILATFQPQTKAPNGSRVHDLIPRKGYPKRPSWNYRSFLLGVQFFSRSHLASSLGAISSTFLLEKVEQLRHDHYCCFMFMAVQRVVTNPLVETTTPNEWLVCHWLLGSKLLHN